MEHPDSQVPIPNNIEGVSIHLSYLRRDMESMNKKLDNLAGIFVTTVDFAEHLKADADHEARIRTLEGFINTFEGKMWGIGVMGSGIAAILSIAISHFWH